MMIRTLLALLLGIAGSSAMAGGDDFVTLVVGGKGSPFPPMLRPPGDTGLSGAQLIGRNFQKLGTSIVDQGGRSSVKTRYREGDWTLEVASSTPPGTDRMERSFTIGYHGPGEVLLRRIEVVLPPIRTQADDLVLRALVAAWSKAT